MKRTMSFATSFRRATGLLLAAAFLFSVAASTASAQLQSTIQVRIPFAFVVGSKTLPAGVYSVERRTQKVLMLRSVDSKDAAMLNAVLVDNGSESERSRLVFNKYGDEYFLSTVVPSFSDVAYRLPPTKQEERLAKASGEPEVVAVAMTPAQ
jgi:hypothetical protein